MIALDRVSPFTLPSSHHADPLTLVAQGGGIGGGAYVVGVMKALKEMGILALVTKTYTSSAAVPAVLYPMLGKDRLVEDVWINEVTKPEVINLRRVFSDSPILDIDHLVDEVLAKHSLSPEAVRQHAAAMYFSVAVVHREIPSIEYGYFRNTDPYPLLEMVRASIAIPLLYGRTVKVGDMECLDGGIIRQTPFPESREPMIVVLTDYVGKSRASGFGERALLRRYPPQNPVEEEIAKAVSERHIIAEKEYARLQRRQERADPIVLIQPAEPLQGDVICSKPKLIEATIRQGYDDAYMRQQELEALCLKKAA